MLHFAKIVLCLISIYPYFCAAKAKPLDLARLIPRQSNGVVTIETFCGASPVDCGNGWCCVIGSTCVTTPKGETACQDGILTDAGG